MVTVVELYPVILADLKSKLPEGKVDLTPADLVQLTGHSTDTQYILIKQDAYDMPVKRRGKLYTIDLYELAMHKTRKVVAMANGEPAVSSPQPTPAKDEEKEPSPNISKKSGGKPGRPRNTTPRRVANSQEKSHQRFWAEYDSLWSLLIANRLAKETIAPASPQQKATMEII